MTRAAPPSCGSGARVIDYSTWVHLSAWHWISAPRHSLWLTVAPTSCYGGDAWMGLFTQFMRWPWCSTTTKCRPNGTLLILGKEEDLRIASARNHTVVSVVFPLRRKCAWRGLLIAQRTGQCLMMMSQEIKLDSLKSFFGPIKCVRDLNIDSV